MLLAAGQRMLNEQIRASTAARERMQSLDGKCFAVAISGTDLRVVAEAKDGEMWLSFGADGDADVELNASAIDLFKLARSATLTDLKDSGAKLNGDLHVAESFADLLRLAMPEPEAALADWIGDMPAHALGRISRGLVGFTRRAHHAFEQNLAEYLQEENPTLIPPALATRFADEVDRLRDDVERAAKRIESLERRLAEGRRAKERLTQRGA
jgi:ubiquinone biosynthesis protein UbiJ